MKITKHKILSILLIVSLTLTVIAGCSSGAGNDAPSPPASEETPEVTPEPEAAPTPKPEETPAPTPETSPSPTDTPEILGDLDITVHSDAITLPMPLEDFLSLGWESQKSEPLEKTLEMKQMYWHMFVKGDLYVHLFIANLSEDQSCTVQQGTIVGLEFPQVWELPGGIKPGVSTKDDLIAVYGEPDSESSGRVFYDKYGFYINFMLDDNDVIKSLNLIFAMHNDYETVS